MGGISGVSPLRVKGPSEYVVVKGSFAPNGGSAIDATKNKGRGFSVARTGAGLFLITFEQVGYDLVEAEATLQVAASADSKAQLGTYDGTAKTLVVRTITGAAAADIAADANNRVNFSATFNQSGTLK